MRNALYLLAFTLFCLSLTCCNGCSKQNETSWADYPDEEYYDEDEYATNSERETNGSAIESPVEVEIPERVTLAEAGQKVYSNLLDWEELYNMGGVKLCAEMSSDRQGKWGSSFDENTTVKFYPPDQLYLHKIFITDISSNIICRIINGEIGVSVSDVQNDIYRTSNEQPAFIINITTTNHTAGSIPVVIPLGQMLEVQSPDVQNIVVCNTYSDILKPYQAKTFSVRAYCGAEKRTDPSRHSVKLTPFVLTAPTYAYNSQSSLWNFQKTSPANDKYYTITFYAWRIENRIGDDENEHISLTGHTFVDIPEIGVVGYGSNGVTDHSSYVQYADYKVSVKINGSDLQKVQNKYWAWKNNPPTYKLAEYDCTNFAMDIADAAGIYYGPRWAIKFPAGFIRNLTATLFLNKMSVQFLNELQTYNE
jgi:hypothetical protein